VGIRRFFVRDPSGHVINVATHLPVEGTSGGLVEHTTDDMDRYLRPLGRRTPIEAITEFVLPLAAIMLSVTAIAISMLKQ